VSAAIAAGITIVPLPGASALITAVTVSGLPTDSIAFEGFLPHKKGRQTALRSFVGETRTLVLYESPHRILKTLKELAEHLGADRRAALCRELTKMHEEINRGTLAELHDVYAARPSIKGEFVVVVEGTGRKAARSSERGSRGSESEDEG
jgi:16S rRNA (cytidine1402-2'-O)-methyltransferase